MMPTLARTLWVASPGRGSENQVPVVGKPSSVDEAATPGI